MKNSYSGTMAEVITSSKRIASALTAVIGASILISSTMLTFDKYREKLIFQPLQLTADTLLVSAQDPQRIMDHVLLLEVKTAGKKKNAKGDVIWNGRAIGRIQVPGHVFFTIPRASFRSPGNILLLRGMKAGDTVAILEVKNLYGYSTGLFAFVMVLPDSPSVRRLSWPLAALLMLGLFFFPLCAPAAMSLTAKNRLLRQGAWAINVFFLAVLALPLVVRFRIFLGLPAVLLLLGVLHLPGLLRFLRLASGFVQSRVLPWIKGKLPLLRLRPFGWKVLAGLALAALFIFFSVHRQRYVGGADWYGYYAESLLFRQGQLTMEMNYSPARYPAFVPLGFYPRQEKAIPQYPPGYPLLLAIFGFAGLEFFVNALCGALSVLILYAILRDIVSRGIAWLYSALWAFFPMTIWGSTFLMSDLVAALFILLTYYFFRRDKIFWSGLAFSYALAVRPSCLLFFFVLLPLLFKKNKFWKFCLSTSIIGGIYGLYNWIVFGKPWISGYGDFSGDLLGAVFSQHFFYYGKTIGIIMTPLLLLPALLPLLRRRFDGWFYFAWLAGFWVFYSFWKSGGDAWWYLRFILPGLPALFILSALGTQDIRDCLLRWKPDWRPILKAGAILLLLVMVPYFYKYSERNRLLTDDKGKIFYTASKKIETLVPPNALLGCMEWSGAISLYTGIESFRWDLNESLALIRDFLGRGRSIYLLIEPWQKDHRILQAISQTFKLETVPNMPEFMDMSLAKVSEL